LPPDPDDEEFSTETSSSSGAPPKAGSHRPPKKGIIAKNSLPRKKSGSSPSILPVSPISTPKEPAVAELCRLMLDGKNDVVFGYLDTLSLQNRERIVDELHTMLLKGNYDWRKQKKKKKFYSVNLFFFLGCLVNAI
jgi:hypothetical protein